MMTYFRWTASAVCIAYVVAAHAQSASAQAEVAQEQGGIDDIVVTAQRRSESMQKVPIAVTAITATKLAAAGINSSQDIAVATPGLTMTNSRNTVTPYLRGVGTQSGNAGSEGAVATYIDGVYISSAAGSIFALNNVERVEVLKGPQGTLFGRNATGGLIQIITRDPSQETALDASLGYGNYDTVTGSAYLTGGLTDRIAADLAVYGSHQGKGWGKNYFLGNDVNLRKEWTVRSKIKFDPGDRTSIVLAGDYAWWNSDIGLTRQTLPNTIAQGNYPHVGTIYDSNASAPLTNQDSHQYGGSLRVTQELSDDITLTSTTAARRYKVQGPLDNDSTPAVLSDVTYIERTKTFQQELLLNGDMDRLNWTAGLFYFRSEAGFQPRVIRTVAPNAQNAQLFSNITTNSYAVFGQANYEIVDDTKLTMGLRYTTEKRNIVGRIIANEGNTVPAGTVTVDTATLPRSITHGSSNKLTWRVGLDHQFGRDALGYITYSRGFKAGGFNSSALTVPPVRPETLDSYEIGLKSDLFNRLIRFNASAFYYDYKNIQLQSFQAFTSVITNAAKSTIKGADAELTIVPPVGRGHLELNGSLSYLHARYDSFPSAQFYTPRNPAVGPFFGGNVASVQDASGNKMIRSPSITVNASTSYSHPVGEAFKAGFDANFSHIGRYYWDPDNRISQAPVDLLNGQIWLAQADDAWKLRLWAKNILKEKYFATVNATSFDDGAAPAPPRTIGVTLDLKFR